MKKVIIRLLGFYLNSLAVVAPRAAGRKGFLLFCTPIRPALKAHQLAYLDTAEKTMLSTEAGDICVYRWGSGEKKILFLHGWQSHSFRWKNYIEAFPTDQYTVYALDAPAHGQSTGKITNILLYAHVIEEFMKLHTHIDAMVGHSLGSFASLYVLHHNPQLSVKQLVITGTPGEVSDFMTFYKQTLRLSDRAMREINNTFVEFVEHPPEYFSAPRFAQGLTLPGLIIHDLKDAEAPHYHAVRIKEAWPAATLHTTSGLGHNLRSAEVVKLVAQFIDQAQVEIPAHNTAIKD